MTAPETCDDIVGTPVNGDGCDTSCLEEVGWTCTGAPSSCTEDCGDGRKVGVETCDDGVAGDGQGCLSDCSGVESGWECSDHDADPTTADQCNLVCGN